MERMTIDEIARAVGCPGSYPGAVDVISTDSRSLPEGCLFVALEGERFDGHDFIPAALRSGAAAAVAHERRDYGPGTVLYVKNTQRALMEIAKAYRAKFSIRCVGVTGSVGKTTTKEMIADVLSCAYRTLKTEGNLNNEIGLPKTLFRLDRTTEAAVVEMGMQGLGEIAALADVARPDVGVITNIGVSHLERLGSRENILKAKLELAEALPDGAPLLLCGDNDLLSRVRIPRLDVRFYGIENPACGLRAKDLREGAGETSFLLCGEFGELPVTIPCAGRHNVLNALAAFSAGLALDIPPEKCAAALREYMPSGMRQKVVHWRGITVVEDCYNASPDSMRAALETLAGHPCTGRRIAVLGGMLELGAISERAHREIGAFAAEKGIDLLLAYGGDACYYRQGASEGGIPAELFGDKEELLARLREEIRPGDAVWVKGSRGMRMEEILEGLYKGEVVNE
ncbi:UDP-N-acetylmuramoyl-tripeptide--D-alanyl-D-alanine ligase [Anaerotruncus massiliensis (ex Liu et al. 2021)]|uniref:UDP-N-acetylmuramoyl-tripeptide--D-alanyl-D-alanine ligase n=2 Tax=Anaerotruncus TaxID=244127 RepID=A0A498CKZ5_9FIRM|nr:MULTISPECIES: UDP-N-acetylmuramoyl-tripeptide--D-alanyl-D-alanine ligase [Anaerotruncus]MBC3939397.1 UDP-N-acetylmuramoyl-tripeptide--D-alanyl-D-alanine ligase [Anaerotruncus massiliensis (ex Togo et al. 2019)]RLL09127.1 UDP-N-acetylmuramoyl-tripeptide--D-alanyl-D-alanine ligase [Anaerotruncus massiliensis (ex Liu et al. 2021)]